MSSAAYLECSIAADSSSQRSTFVANSALTDFRSVLLKIVFRTSVFCPSDKSDNAPFRSLKMSFIDRISPELSSTLTPSSFNFAAALSVGAVSDKITLRKAVPPSAPFTPLSANRPKTVFSSVVPPASVFAVPPTVRIAAPICDTLALAFEDAAAIWSTSVVA